ncbi:transcription antitermination factor NusB [Alkalibacter mobilis]|uniref:transcription antitermination factor NusB n=1 Tax=Alkalibacter mobilis TaxID=2787712 RepID=UPI00189C70CB|nr:transcription antitermination factor NusB [Alkalibacter mobilis]MBF7097109.1 transcription antitermination factor NusB [Alkalibacter mobilis]
MSRKFAREIVLKTVFQMNFATEIEESDLEESMIEKLIYDNTEMNEEEIFHELSEEDVRYIKDIIIGVKQKKEILDEQINKHLVNWKIDRLNMLDAAMLRIASYEILFLKKTPKAVIINEALNLISRFGDSDSTKYINAVLDKLN